MDELIDIPSTPGTATSRSLTAAVVLAVLGAAAGWLTAASRDAVAWVYPVGLGVLGGILLWPALPVTLYYPLIWPAWSYQFPVVGAPERAIGLMAILGLGVAVLRFRSRLPSFPSVVTLGTFLLVVANLASALLHPEATGSLEFIISLFLRLAFFYLIVFHLQTRKQLRWSLGVFITSGLGAAVLILFLTIKLGFGFTRVIPTADLPEQALGPFWTNFALNANFDTAVALLLWCLYPLVRSRAQKWSIAGTTIFLFLMAFAAQYRREILIAIPVLLLWLIIDKSSGLRRPTVGLVAAMGIVFLIVILPTQVLQDRLEYETQFIQSGDEARIVSMRAGLTAFPGSLLIGYGLGMYERTVAPIIGPAIHDYVYHPYNTFIWLAVESGLFAVIGMALIMLGVYRRARQALPGSAGVENWVLRCAPALMLQIFIWSTFGNAFEVSIPWFLMGVILAAARMAESAEEA